MEDLIQINTQRINCAAGCLYRAMSNGETDTDALDFFAEELLIASDTFDSFGVEDYLRYIEYLRTHVGTGAARERELRLQARLGVKVRALYAAIALAEDIHYGQIGPDGEDYFTSVILPPAIAVSGDIIRMPAVLLREAEQTAGIGVDELMLRLQEKWILLGQDDEDYPMEDGAVHSNRLYALIERYGKLLDLYPSDLQLPFSADDLDAIEENFLSLEYENIP